MSDYSTLEARIAANLTKRASDELGFDLCRKALITLRNIDPSWNAELRSIGARASVRFERFARGVERQQTFNNPRAQTLLDAIVAERVKARLLGKKIPGIRAYGQSALWNGPSLQSIPRIAHPLTPNTTKPDSV